MTRGVFDGDDKIAEYLIRHARGGRRCGDRARAPWGSLRLGAVWTQVNARVETGDPVLPSMRELTAGPRGRSSLDQFDSAWFPRAGYLADT